MDIALPPVMPTGPSRGHALPLQTGQIMAAEVVALLKHGVVRLAVANTLLDVPSMVPLLPGAKVKLEVQNTPTGLRLVILHQGMPQQAGAGASFVPAGAAPATTPAAVFLAAAALTGTAAGAAPAAAPDGAVRNDIAAPSLQAATTTRASALLPDVTSPSIRPAAPHEALGAAVRAAAPRQGGLASLFADVAQAIAQPGAALPAPVRAIAQALLALRMPLDGTLGAADLKQALARSGLLLEARLAAQAAGAPAAAPAPPLDLKLALLVFRQVLQNWIGELPRSPASLPAPVTMPAAQAMPAGSQPPATGSPVAIPQSGVPAPASSPLPAGTSAPVTSPPAMQVPAAAGAAPSAPAPGADTALPTAPAATPAARGIGTEPTARLVPAPAVPTALPLTPPAGAAMAQAAASAPSLGRKAVAPPPPYRGAQPVGQPPATVPADAVPRDIAARLIERTEAALARHTLLQAASLPERADSDLSRAEAQGPRWAFEVPLATPQGTGIAQFEIARDGRNAPAEGQAATWRVRFSLDLEPMGPVHALVTLTGDRAAVTLWAERADTAKTFDAHAQLLGEALRAADLEPGQVEFRVGAPRPAQPAAPGRFMDRAS